MNHRTLTLGASRFFSKKQWTITIVTMTLACVLGGMLVVIPRNFTAHAAGATIYVVPKSGSFAFQSAIFVQGSHYAAGEPVQIYWNYTGPSTGTLVASATADATGSFGLKFNMPLSATGIYTIAGIGQTSGSVATTIFQLLPQLFATPEAGGPSAKFNIYGNAFGNGETVNIYTNYTGLGTGNLLATATGNTTGSFTVSVSIPKTTTPGSLPITGVGQTSNTTASFSFVVYQPTLALAPLSGSAGTQLIMTAFGFQKFEKINIFWNNGSTPVLVGKTDSNVYGYMPPTAYSVPPGTASGTYPINAVGQTSGITATTNFILLAPGASLTPTSGPTGTSVNISGKGFNPGETTNVVWGYVGPGTGMNIANITAGGSGIVNGSFVVPTASSGAHTVALVGATSGIVVKAAYTVGSGLAARPGTTIPEANVTLTGTGYQAGETVQIYLDNTTSTVLATATADANGNVSQAVTIPASASPGSHSLIGVGQTSSISFSTSLTLDTPWSNFGNDAAQDRLNITENTLANTNVGSLNLKWSAKVGTNFRGSPVYANGLVYVVSPTGILYAFNTTSGALKWKFISPLSFKNLSAPAVDPATGMVFFGTIGYEATGVPSPFYALDAQTGTLEWSMILAWNVFSPPTVAMNTLFVGTDRGPFSTTLYSIDEVTGNVNWQYSANGSVWGAIAVDASTSTAFAFVSNPGSSLVALDTTLGTVKWQQSIANSASSTEYGSSVAVANGMVYFNGKNGNVYAYNENTGTPTWTNTIGDQPTGSGNVASLAVANGIVYAGSLNNALFALNANTGVILWWKSVGIVWGSPIVANGVVYYTALGKKRVEAMNATSGAPLWNYLTSGLIYSSPIVVNGWLYCGSTDGKLYAFSL